MVSNRSFWCCNARVIMAAVRASGWAPATPPSQLSQTSRCRLLLSGPMSPPWSLIMPHSFCVPLGGNEEHRGWTPWLATARVASVVFEV